MNAYLVYISDLLDRITHTTFCKNDKELSSLLSNLDKDNYRITSIEVIDSCIKDIAEFIKKDKNLETG